MNNLSLDELVFGIANTVDITQEDLLELRRPVRRRSRPNRDLLIYLAWRNSELSVSDPGGFFGVSYSSIAGARARSDQVLNRSRKLSARLKESGYFN